MICKYGNDLAKGMSRSLRKYMAENPLCKIEAEYEGFCIKHLPYDLKLRYEWEQTPQEKRQQYLDLVNSGKSIGEAREIAGVSFEAALEITNRAINTYRYLDKVAA